MTRNSKIFVNQFIPFLFAHQAFDLYVSNFIVNFPCMPLNQFIDSTLVNCWITCAFVFCNTPEGFDFWNRMSKEWQSVARHF